MYELSYFPIYLKGLTAFLLCSQLTNNRHVLIFHFIYLDVDRINRCRL
jgi:hypothetical protein